MLVFSYCEYKECEADASLRLFARLNLSDGEDIAHLRGVYDEATGEVTCYEQLSFVDGLYMTIVTISTVGYGDFSPSTDAMRWFTMLYILFGCGYGAFIAVQHTVSLNA